MFSKIYILYVYKSFSTMLEIKHTKKKKEEMEKLENIN